MEAGAPSVDDFADYKAVDGIQVAHTRSSKTVGRATALKLSKVEINPTIDPSTFQKPPK